MLPLLLKGQVNTARLNKIKPELDVIQAEMRELSNTQDTMKKSLAAMKMQKLLKDNNCHPLKVCNLTALKNLSLFNDAFYLNCICFCNHSMFLYFIKFLFMNCE